MAIPRRFLSTNHSLSSPPSVAKAAAAEPPSEANVESDFVVILAALLCALICVVGLIAVARCAWLRRGGGAGENGRGGPHPAANKGLKKKVLQSLPKFIYGPAFVAENGCKKFPADCAICLADYVDGDEIRMLPQCGHGFHVQCIDTWLGAHSSCPSCRQILVVARCRKCGGGEFPSISDAGDYTGTGTQSRGGDFLV